MLTCFLDMEQPPPQKNTLAHLIQSSIHSDFQKVLLYFREHSTLSRGRRLIERVLSSPRGHLRSRGCLESVGWKVEFRMEGNLLLPLMPAPKNFAASL